MSNEELHTILYNMNIDFNIEYKVIICKLCKQGITPKNFSAHIRQKHNNKQHSLKLLGYLLKEIMNDASSIDIKVPNIPIPFISNLPIHNGYACNDKCLFTVNKHWMNQHSQKLHQQSNFYHPVKLQTFFNKKSPYFQVITPDLTKDTSLISTMMDIFYKSEKQQEQLNQLTPAYLDEKDQLPWFKLTGFPSHLKSLNRKDLISLISLPLPKSEQTHKLSLQFASFNRLFDNIYSATDDYLPVLLEWMKSPRENEPATKAFQQVQELSTWVKYIRYWKQLIIYIVHTSYLSQTGKSQEGVLYSLISSATSIEITSSLSKWQYSLKTQDTNYQDVSLLTLLMALIQQR